MLYDLGNAMQETRVRSFYIADGVGTQGPNTVI